MANKRCNEFLDLNDGANLIKLELKLGKDLNNASEINLLVNLTFTLSLNG